MGLCILKILSAHLSFVFFIYFKTKHPYLNNLIRNHKIYYNVKKNSAGVNNAKKAAKLPANTQQNLHTQIIELV